VATITTLSDRLRSELGDTARHFAFASVGNGAATSFILPDTPVLGTSLVVLVAGVDVSATTSVNEHTGEVILATAPILGASVAITGTYFRYFTESEIQAYLTTAISQHSLNAVDTLGRQITLASLPGIEEYPVVLLASTMALYTLATDASFDIDISAPDGVHIPRSERFRQLMEIISARKEQYRELCTLLGIGMYRIENFMLRRVSRVTNHLVPVYRKQEIDDRSLPVRVYLQIPTLGGQPLPDAVPEQDFNLYKGDSFEATLVFPYDISGYDFKSQIHYQAGDPVILATFAITKVNTTTLLLRLTSAQTSELPQRSFWDIQATSPTDSTYEVTYMKGFVFTERQVTT
jgi:hypothetical protein